MSANAPPLSLREALASRARLALAAVPQSLPGGVDAWLLQGSPGRALLVHVHVASLFFPDLEALTQEPGRGRRRVLLVRVPVAYHTPAVLDGLQSLLQTLQRDDAYQEFEAIAAVVREDGTYAISDLDLEVQRQRQAQASPLRGEVRRGRLHTWYGLKGFGFLTANGETYFVHGAQLSDPQLREAVTRALPDGGLAVRFTHGGNDGRRYARALSVVRDGGPHDGRG